MRILAIETAGTTGSVALLNDETLVAEQPLDAATRSAQSLAPGIAALLHEAGWQPRDVELVAVATGPGSFTGLRIGVTTAKMFAFATGCQVMGVNTLRAIASRVPVDVPRFSVVLDAQRGELFVADFERQAEGQPAGEETTRIVNAKSWLTELPTGAVVTGTGLKKWADQLSERAHAVDAALWAPVASAIGREAVRAYREGRRITPVELVPYYFRRTAAEETWDLKHGT